MSELCQPLMDVFTLTVLLLLFLYSNIGNRDLEFIRPSATSATVPWGKNIVVQAKYYSLQLHSIANCTQSNG